MFEIEEFSNAGNIHFAILPIFARIGGCIVRDELLEQVLVEVLDLSAFRSTTTLTSLVFRITFQLATPIVIRGRIAIVVRGAEGSYEPVGSKESGVEVIPRVRVFMTNRIAQSHSGFVRLMR